MVIFLTVFYFSVKSPSDAPRDVGLDVDFFINIKGSDSKEPQHCSFEYKEGKKWVKIGAGLDIKNNKKKDVATLIQSFTVNDFSDSIRVRVCCPYAAGEVALQTGTWGKPQLVCYPGINIKDSKRIAIVGNSFTFFYSSNFFLKQLARLHGHQIEMSCSLKGGQNLLQHTALERTIALQKATYDIIFFQDQSQASAKLASNPSGSQFVLEGVRNLTKAFRKNSPNARIIYECTWAYEGKDSDFGGFGTMENFDRLLRIGSETIKTSVTGIDAVSPIGQAFEKARLGGFDLYYKDNKHQGQLGSYLKACVNYLLIYGEPFDETLDLSCGINHETAKSLREIATQIVFKD